MSIINLNGNNNVNSHYEIKNNCNDKVKLAATSNLSFSDILKSDDTDTRIMDEINKESDPIDREEDTILYQNLKNAGLDLKNYSLKWYKENTATLGFPPLTAPGYIRKAWREMLKGMSPEQKEEFNHNIINIMASMRYNDNNLDYKMASPGFDYSNFIDKMLNYILSARNSKEFDYLFVSKYMNILKKGLNINK